MHIDDGISDIYLDNIKLVEGAHISSTSLHTSGTDTIGTVDKIDVPIDDYYRFSLYLMH